MKDLFDPSAVVPGYTELCDWYGSFPTFHDAYVNRLDLHVDGSGEMVIRGFQVTKEVDARGKFVLAKHFRAKFCFEAVRDVELGEFAPDRAILFNLEVRKHKHGIEIELLPTYGVGGRITMERLTIAFEPVDYDGSWPPT